MRIYDLIAKKRDGGTHTREELEAIVVARLRRFPWPVRNRADRASA